MDNFESLKDSIRSAIAVIREAVLRIEADLGAIASELQVIVIKYQAMEKALREYKGKEE